MHAEFDLQSDMTQLHIDFVRLEKSVFATGKFCKMQLAKCKMQNARRKMQDAKCKLQNETAVANRGSLTCSYLQTTSSHFGRDL